MKCCMASRLAPLRSQNVPPPIRAAKVRDGINESLRSFGQQNLNSLSLQQQARFGFRRTKPTSGLRLRPLGTENVMSPRPPGDLGTNVGGEFKPRAVLPSLPSLASSATQPVAVASRDLPVAVSEIDLVLRKVQSEVSSSSLPMVQELPAFKCAPSSIGEEATQHEQAGLAEEEATKATEEAMRAQAKAKARAAGAEARRRAEAVMASKREEEKQTIVSSGAVPAGTVKDTESRREFTEDDFNRMRCLKARLAIAFVDADRSGHLRCALAII